ncbi:MAG: TspO/MBR family protein [Pseudomonadota bacterium]
MQLTLFFTYLAACAAAAATGALFQPGDWYRDLQKPRWTPPDWLFPVAWTVLYLSISIAAARVAALPGTGQALAFWSMQIALNTLWTPVFFGLRRMGAGLVVLGLLWLAVAATMVAFFQHDLIAGLLFVPYLIWVSVAGALNRSVWVLNR